MKRKALLIALVGHGLGAAYISVFELQKLPIKQSFPLSGISKLLTGIPDVPLLLHIGQWDLITKSFASRSWLPLQKLAEFHFKEWAFCYHDLFQEPEQEAVFQQSLHFAQTAVDLQIEKNRQ